MTAQGNSVCGFFGNACGRCAANEGCVQGRCTAVIDVDAGTVSGIGGPCLDDSQCGSDSNSFCIPDDSGFPGGYCTRMCDMEMCPLNSECVELGLQGGGTILLCLSECFSSTCRQGYQCTMVQSGGVCLPQ